MVFLRLLVGLYHQLRLLRMQILTQRTMAYLHRDDLIVLHDAKGSLFSRTLVVILEFVNLVSQHPYRCEYQV
jgi:hypothetical protein